MVQKLLSEDKDSAHYCFLYFQKMVIQYFRADTRIKRSEVAELCKLSPDQARRLLQKLVKVGKLL